MGKKGRDEIGGENPVRTFFDKAIAPSYPFLKIYPDSPMMDLLKSLNLVTKRIPVLDPLHHRVTKIISQSAVINLVNRRIMELKSKEVELPPDFNRSAKKLGFIKDVIW